MCNRPSKRFDAHVWMISKLLTVLRNQTELVVLLLCYITAACFRKMLRRLDHEILEPFLSSLTKLTTFKLTERPQPASPAKLRRDKDFLLAIRSFRTDKPIPKIKTQAQAASTGEAFEVYTEDTCMEFHRLLCELLE